MKKIIWITLLISSCGPSSEDMARIAKQEKAAKDSIAKFEAEQKQKKLLDSLDQLKANDILKYDYIIMLVKYGKKRQEVETLNIEQLDSAVKYETEKAIKEMSQ